jgi:hypothetical protein
MATAEIGALRFVLATNAVEFPPGLNRFCELISFVT